MYMYPQPRDGRQLRCQPKPKSYLAVERFLSRGGGFFGAGPDATLADMGLSNIMPSHYTRLSSLMLLQGCRMLHVTLMTKEDCGLHLPLHEEVQRHPERGSARVVNRMYLLKTSGRTSLRKPRRVSASYAMRHRRPEWMFL